MSEQSEFREWVVDFLCEQIRVGKLTRDEAAAHINAAVGRMTIAGAQDTARADRVAKAMVAQLPRAPANGA